MAVEIEAKELEGEMELCGVPPGDSKIQTSHVQCLKKRWWFCLYCSSHAFLDFFPHYKAGARLGSSELMSCHFIEA